MNGSTQMFFFSSIDASIIDIDNFYLLVCSLTTFPGRIRDGRGRDGR